MVKSELLEIRRIGNHEIRLLNDDSVWTIANIDNRLRTKRYSECFFNLDEAYDEFETICEETEKVAVVESIANG